MGYKGMGTKGKAGALISGFMTGFNAERDRRDDRQAQAHKEAMDKSLKEYREVETAANKAAAEVAASDRKRDEATVQGIMKENPEQFKYWLEEEITSHANFMGNADVEGKPQSMQGFMGSGDKHRTHMAPTLEYAQGKMEQVSRDKQTKATTDLRIAQTDAAKARTAIDQTRANTEATRLKVNTENAERSRQTMIAITQEKFPGTFQRMDEAGFDITNLSEDGVKLIYASLMQEVRDRTLTVPQLEDKHAALVEMLKQNNIKTNALYGATVPPEGDAKSTIEANDRGLRESIGTALREIEDRLTAKRLELRAITEAGLPPQDQARQDIPAAHPDKGRPGYEAAQQVQQSPYGSFGPPQLEGGAGMPTAPTTGLMNDAGDNPSNY